MAEAEAHHGHQGKSPNSDVTTVLVLLSVAMFVPLLMAVATWIPKTERLTVSDMTWERLVDVCEVRPVRHEGWELPEGATLISAEKRVYQYIRRMHQFRGTPVYADWYVYEIDEPVTVRTARAAGHKGEEMSWPEPGLQAGQGTQDRREKLTVVASDGTSYSVDSDIWDQLDIGDTADAKIISHEGQIVSVTVV